MGQGGYAKCYQVSAIDQKTKKKSEFACKIIEKKKLFCHEGDDEKTRLNIERRKKIVEKELQLHKCLNHQHIVQFKHFFEDQDSIYILLELCE